MVVDEDLHSYDFLMFESIWKYLSGALQGLDRGFHPCVTVAVAQLVGETSHDHEKGLNQRRIHSASRIKAMHHNLTALESPPIDLQGDAFEGSCSQIELRQTLCTQHNVILHRGGESSTHGLPPSALAHSPPKAMQLSLACSEAAVGEITEDVFASPWLAGWMACGWLV
ncbi:hypothetical protein NA56DRAFT_702706 [Hyaloscypha hepaticicola]|uniref:Uncharacterized protein n=1 Tax=Hyaloscypha hepaticicola TaxID=2082293 RepID=A0A2J6Q7V1_9HELO|nr:hypothetical protein NA56DRAFT_702706 [Hyaloscypha hepaticicola]